MLTYQLEVKGNYSPDLIKELYNFTMNCDGEFEYKEFGNIFNKHLIVYIKVENKYQSVVENIIEQLEDYYNGVNEVRHFGFFVWLNRKDKVANHWKIQLTKLKSIFKVKCINFGLFSFIKCDVYKISENNAKLLDLAIWRYKKYPNQLFS